MLKVEYLLYCYGERSIPVTVDGSRWQVYWASKYEDTRTDRLVDIPFNRARCYWGVSSGTPERCQRSPPRTNGKHNKVCSCTSCSY